MFSLQINESTTGISTVGDYTLVKNKEESAEYRSVVFRSDANAKNANILLCVSPPDATDLLQFEERNKILSDEDAPESLKTIHPNGDLYANEAIEGTMINLFWDPVLGKWEIATKSTVGGNSWYFRTNYFDGDAEQKTFREMFVEAMMVDQAQDQDQDLDSLDSLDPLDSLVDSVDPLDSLVDSVDSVDSLNKIPLLKNLDKNYCYSFVLQHPSNHIVLNLTSAAVYLVSVFRLDRENNLAQWISPKNFQNWEIFKCNQSVILFPKEHDISSMHYAEIWFNLCSPKNTNPNKNQSLSLGVMIHNLISGERTIMRNHTYVDARKIRGNHPNLQYQFLELQQTPGATAEFLQHFPQYKDAFDTFYEEFCEFVQQVHSAYISYYIKKTGERVAKRLFPMVFRVHHEEFLVSRKVMRRPLIHAFLVKQPVGQLIYYLNLKEKEEEADIVN
jgi:hypothetical protein